MSLILMILDGFGLREDQEDNAISRAAAPFWQSLSSCPHSELKTCGRAVGLPDGQMGNSEVGHMNIGAGRVVLQDFVRIDESSRNDFADCPAFAESLAPAGVVHLIGLFSPGGVHAHERHLFAAARRAVSLGASEVYLHLIGDGRDTPPQSLAESLPALKALCQEMPRIRVLSLSGRFYGMDRDQRWERIEAAYRLIAQGASEHAYDSVEAALHTAYARGESDEFIQPSRIGAARPIQAGESVWFINFRADRARQLTQAFVDPKFTSFSRPLLPLHTFLCMTEYQHGLPARVAFAPQTIEHTLGQVISEHGLRQLRIAETEKYAHVTYFFNGGRETPYAGEDRLLIPSPQVATYDLQPEMSLAALKPQLLEAIDSKRYALIVCNLANPDMVGHTGKLAATIAAVEAVDQVLQAVCQHAAAQGMDVLISADHGNAEQMHDPESGQAHTAHTTNPVPLVYVGQRALHLRDGALCDLAPSILALLALPQPQEMSGKSLVQFDVQN